ncbi:hypothetical protein EYZ11_011714 [Aspergillus tanneri]|uniref:Uncharacterized protein n=1 Tax=Aspergillus tanneri TaxID=1220188 RepID=A0A4S3J235_9EURO|nr:hypothetical protein EYZ11_011714 [Aspergillus tanneri]
MHLAQEEEKKYSRTNK